MPADLSLEPWVRLDKLSPPTATEDDKQQAADRYALTVDLYAALADLWEDAANQVNIIPVDPVASDPVVQSESVSQDGVSRSVTYASTPVVDTHASRVAQYNAYLSKSRQYRARAKTRTALLDGRDDDIFEYVDPLEDVIIPVIP